MGHPLGVRGEALGLLARYAEAERDLRSAVRLSSEWVGADHPWTAYDLTALGKTLIAEGHGLEAVSVLKHALRIRESSEPNAELVAETRFALARATWDLGQDRAAAQLLARSARDTYRARSGHDREIAAIDTWLAARSPGRPRSQGRVRVR
jgi:tetratricopeptide (TPR) repeat protein